MQEQKPENTEQTEVMKTAAADNGAAAGPTPPAAVLAPDIPAGKPPKRFVVSFGRILALFLAVAAVAFGSYYFLHRSKHTTQVARQNKPASAAVATPAKPGIAQPTRLTTVDATYLSASKQLGDLHVFAKPSNLGEICPDGSQCRPVASADIQYYQIGSTKDGSQIIVFVAPTGGPGDDEQIMLGKGGTYKILAQMDSASADVIKTSGAAAFIKTNGTGYSPNVSFDVTTRLAGLGFADTITAKGQTFVRDYDDKNGNYGYFMPRGLSDIRGNYYGATTATPVKLGAAGNKSLYSLVAKDDANFQVVEDYATFGSLFANRYDLQNSLLSGGAHDKALNVHWESGRQNQSSYFSAASGCGTSGYVVAKSLTASQLTEVGSSDDGQVLYQLPISAPLSQELYNKDYGESRKYLSDASLINLTMQQFMDDHAYVIFKDTLGEYVVLQRSDMFETGGCAKPVVYLYPQQETSVSVQVGADITKSDPLYTANGWQNVLAEPSGRLSYGGKAYDSLFWEGEGYGGYPSITSGTVVASNRAVATITSQLKAQGLNAKEIGDFLAYWQPKLPKTPYVRLTWFDTAQMNRLAPLHVSPAPQTLIRVFLDFQGLQKPEKLPAQQFVAPARRGFTVVEWGGLARNGLQG